VRDPQLVLLLVQPQVHHLAQVADLPKGPRHPPLPLTPLLTVHRPACIQVPNLQQGHPPVLPLVPHQDHLQGRARVRQQDRVEVQQQDQPRGLQLDPVQDLQQGPVQDRALVPLQAQPLGLLLDPLLDPPLVQLLDPPLGPALVQPVVLLQGRVRDLLSDPRVDRL
jgi:hypothetical protein